MKKTSTKFYWRIWDGGKKENPTGCETADTSCFITCDSNIPTSPPQVLHSEDHMAPVSCQQHWADGGQKNPAKLDPSLQLNQSGPGQTRVQPSVPMEMSVWQVAESSHTDSTRLKCRKPSAKPQPTSDRWCFPSNTRDTPTRKAHRQSRILRGTWRTGGGHTWIRFVNCFRVFVTCEAASHSPPAPGGSAETWTPWRPDWRGLLGTSTYPWQCSQKSLAGNPKVPDVWPTSASQQPSSDLVSALQIER